MALPRSKYVSEGKEGVYHCFTRCVRRAFLYGFDAHTRRDFSHRKAWLVDRLRQLAGIFAVDVCAYAVMENHYHIILRIRPDIATAWSDQQVATRWLTLFPRRCCSSNAETPPIVKQIRALMLCPDRIVTLRKRLCSLSWFMSQLNEFIARAANKEDTVKGRFWESRFKCQALLDDAAITSCMVYVDLNPIRAGLARTPEGSEFTSIQERIHAWYRETMTTASVSTNVAKDNYSESLHGDTLTQKKAGKIANLVPKRVPAMSDSHDNGVTSTCWLCPISSEADQRGILPMAQQEYFDLVDRSGRMIRLEKRGAIGADLAPILLRIGVNPEVWPETISRFGDKFRLAAGMLSSLRNFADQLGKRWFTGVTSARIFFVPSP